MEKKWNLQDIQPASPRKRKRPQEERVETKPRVHQEINDENDGVVRIGVEDGRKKGRSGLYIALILFFVILGGGFFVSLMTGGAEVTVYPRTKTPNVNANFTAYAKPQAGELSYEIMTLEAEGERQVSATGKEEVKEQATGEIVVYNKTDGAERLVKNTRFQTPSGLIFKLTESVLVPAAGTNADGETVPGSIRAAVFAENAGEEYNIPPTKMNIPGYKEGGYMDLYNGIHGENPATFTGGFDGMKFIIDDQELDTEKQRLQVELRNALLDKIDDEKPAGFVVFDDAVAITYESLPAVEYGDNLATIKEKALLQIPIFKDEDFASYIAAATVPGYEGNPVRIDNLSEMKFSYTNATTAASDISKYDSVTFTLIGKPQIVWTYDEGKLKTDILNKAKTALPQVLGAYPAIKRAEAVVRPFWKTSFPHKMDDVTIIEVVSEE